jgi:hypothetical protein
MVDPLGWYGDFGVGLMIWKAKKYQDYIPRYYLFYNK